MAAPPSARWCSRWKPLVDFVGSVGLACAPYCGHLVRVPLCVIGDMSHWLCVEVTGVWCVVRDSQLLSTCCFTSCSVRRLAAGAAFTLRSAAYAAPVAIYTRSSCPPTVQTSRYKRIQAISRSNILVIFQGGGWEEDGIGSWPPDVYDMNSKIKAKSFLVFLVLSAPYQTISTIM